MMTVIFNGHEWEPGEPCKHCGMRKEEILREPQQQCKDKAANQHPKTAGLAAIISVAFMIELIGLAAQLL